MTFGVHMNRESNSSFYEILEQTRVSINVDEIRDEATVNNEKHYSQEKASFDKGRKPAVAGRLSFENDGKYCQGIRQ